MSCPYGTGVVYTGGQCTYDWMCDECPHTTNYDELSSDDLRRIMYQCKDILNARKEYLWKVSTDGC